MLWRLEIFGLIKREPAPSQFYCDIIFLLAGVTGDLTYIITNLLDLEAISRKQTGPDRLAIELPEQGENSLWRSVISERHQRGVQGINRKKETHCCAVTPIQYWGLSALFFQ